MDACRTSAGHDMAGPTDTNPSGSGPGLPEEQVCFEETQLGQEDVTPRSESEVERPANIDIGADLGFSNEQMQSWIQLGAAISFLGEMDGVDSIPEAFWDRYRPVVEKATAMDLVYAASFLPGESFKTAFFGIGILSDYRYNCKTTSGAIPALSVEFIIQYQSFVGNSHFTHCSMGMYAVIMKEGGYAFSIVADSLGAGNSTIYSAAEALEENGLRLYADHINAPGAGRNDIDTVFAHDILPEVIATGIKYEELHVRKSLQELKELGVKDEESIEGDSEKTDTPNEKSNLGLDNEKAGHSETRTSPDGSTHSVHQASDSDGCPEQATSKGGSTGQPEEPNYKTCKTEEVNPLELKEETLKAVDESVKIISFALEGKKMDYELWDLKKHLEKDKIIVEAFYTIVCEDDESEGVRTPFNLLPAFVDFCDALRNCCETLIQVKAQNEDAFDKEKEDDPVKADYWRKKLLRGVLSRKKFLRDLVEEEGRYARICELLEEIKSYVATVEMAGQEEGAESEKDSFAEEAKQYEEGRAKAFSGLEAIIHQMTEALEQMNKGTKFYQKAEETIKFLHTLKEDLARAAQPELSENSDVRILQEVMVTMLEFYMREAQRIWASAKKKRDSLKHVVDFFCTKKFTDWVLRTFTTYNKVFQEFQNASKTAPEQKAMEGPNNKDEDADEAVTSPADDALKEALDRALESIDAAFKSYVSLISMLRKASDNQVLRKKVL